MWRVLLVAIGVLTLLTLLFVVWRVTATVVGGAKLHRALLERISPVTDAIRKGQKPDPADVRRFAESRETRKVLFQALRDLGRADLFPEEYRRWEKVAEADLSFWLQHPNELGAPPDEIELMARVPVLDEDKELTYFVFRFCVHEPHWAASDGYMAGIAGPYDTRGGPSPHAPGTFSRFEAYDSRTPEEHVAVVRPMTRRSRHT